MTLTLAHVAPAEPTPDERTHWLCAVTQAAPDMPFWNRFAVARMLANRAASSDALLWLADAFTEAAGVAGEFGDGALAIQLHQLSELPRRLAPQRADGLA